jgi:hypothetical protein
LDTWAVIHDKATELSSKFTGDVKKDVVMLQQECEKWYDKRIAELDKMTKNPKIGKASELYRDSIKSLRADRQKLIEDFRKFQKEIEAVIASFHTKSV